MNIATRLRMIDPKAAAGSDPHFANVSLLLHMDGTNGSKTFVDSSSNKLTVTTQGNAQISTTQSKFGGAAGAFIASSSYLSFLYNSAFNYGINDFTVECWVYPTFSSGIYGVFATSGGSGSNPKFVVHLDSLTPKIHWNNLANGSNLYTSATSAVTVNQWSHIAFIRKGTAWTWYINGVASGTGVNSTDITFSSQQHTYVGYGGEGYFVAFNGYIDELRITKGVARYTANFPVPIAPFPDH